MVEMECMAINERRKSLYKMWERYRKAKRKEKGRLLEEMQAVTGMHRESRIRILIGWLLHKKRSRERGRRYSAAVEDAVRGIARRPDWPLQVLRSHINPIRLCQLIADWIEQLWTIPAQKVAPPVNIFQTLRKRADPSGILSFDLTGFCGYPCANSLTRHLQQCKDEN